MLRIWKLGLMSFDTAMKIQIAMARKHLDALAKGLDSQNDTLLLLEHKPVFTIGIRDKTSKEEIMKLRSLGAAFRKTNRGGLITFHGPGQLVAYPIINLKHFNPSVKCYVNNLEETIIRLCNDLGVYYYIANVFFNNNTNFDIIFRNRGCKITAHGSMGRR